MKRIFDKSAFTENDWQNYRRKQKGIGGSDVATILGMNPWKTAFTLWLEKTGQIEPEPVNNESVEWGNILEPVIRAKFQRETGFEVIENPWVMAHDDYDFMVANIDGEVFDPEMGEWGVLEIKTAGDRYKSEWEFGPPNHYHLQIQHYLAVMNYNYAYVACLLGGNHFKYFKIERDDYVIDKIISAEVEFMRLVTERVPPEISGQEADTNYLAKAYPEASDEEAELSQELEALAIRYLEIQGEMKVLGEESDYIKNRIKLEAKEFKVLKSDRIRISMPNVKKVLFDSKAFAADHPNLFEEYKTKASNYRNFTIIRRE
jgi:putative phage-type endonuclease